MTAWTTTLAGPPRTTAPSRARSSSSCEPSRALLETGVTRATEQALRPRRAVFQSKRIARLRDRLLSRAPAEPHRGGGAPDTPASRAAYRRIRPLAEAMYLVMAVNRSVSGV